MDIPVFDLKRQHESIREEIDEAIARVLKSGWFILGPEVEAFEREFAAYCGCKYGIGVGSGTAALQLALAACGVGPGDEVITAPNTCVPTVAAIEMAGGRPVFVDIDPQTYNIDPANLRRAVFRDRVRAIVPVHLSGHPADMNPILEIAQRHGLWVIEDCAQAHGAEYERRRVGGLGHAGCFSFYPTKNLGAYGDGGMVVTSDKDIACKVRALRQYGWEERYISTTRGFNSRLDELQAAILRVKLRHLEWWNGRRRALARLYSVLLEDSNIVAPTEASYARHVFHQYAIRHPHRDELREWLTGYGIGTNIHYPAPVHLQPAYRDLGYKEGDFPIAEEYARQVLSLPMYPELRGEEVGRVCEQIQEWSDYEQDDPR